MAFERAKLHRLRLGDPATLRGGSTLWALDETTPAALAANRAFFGEPLSATITSLFTAQSTWAIGLRHVFCKLRNSIPLVGAVKDGHGEWYLLRGGSIVSARTAIGTLDFSTEAQDGDEIVGRFVDVAGNAGAWETFTVSVTGTANYTQYVSAAGSDSNAGTSEVAAVLTFAQAWANAMANLTAGQAAVIYCRRGDTFASSAGVSFTGTSQRLVIVDAYGTGARPLLTWPHNTNGISVGNWGSVHLRNIEMDGQDTGLGDSGPINYTRTAGNHPIDLMIVNCVLRNWTWTIRLTGDNAENGTNWTDGRGDWIAVTDSQLINAGSIHFFSSFAQRYTLLRDTALLDTNGENNDNIWRVARWKDQFLHRVTWDAGNNASLRCQTGPALGPTDTWGPGSWLDCTYTSAALPDQHFLANMGFSRTAPDGAGAGYATDMRFVGCRWNYGQTNFAGVEVTNVQFWACTITGGWWRTQPNSGMTPGAVHSIEFRDCIRIDQATDGHTCFWFQDAASFYDADSVTITGCSHYVRAGLGTRQWIQASQMTIAEMASKIAESNGNRIGLASTGSYNWIQATDDTWPLAAWQTTGWDAASSVTASVGTANFTNVGTALASVDFHRTASASYLNDAGFVRLGRDAEGRVRSGTAPDAGPFEYGAGFPDLPPTSGPSGLTADGAGFFAIFGDADAGARVAADGAGFVALFGDAEADAKIAADGAGFVALWGDAEVSEAIGGVDPPGATGIGYVSIWGDAEAAARIAGDGAGFVALFGDASAGARIVADGVGFVSLFGDADANVVVPANNADGVGFVSLWGDADALVVPASTGRGVQLVNDSADLFEGVVSINTDLPVPDAYGQRNGITFVRGLPSSLDTTRVDLIVSIPAGGSITLPDLIAETTIAPTPPTVPPDFFGGDPQIGGVPFTKIGEETDGLTVVTEWRLRSGVWIVYLISYWVPGEPWAVLESLTLHSNPTSASLREFWPAWLITWGTGTVEFLGRTSDGSVVAAARGFGDGQCQLRPGLAWWPTRYRNAQDTANVAAMRTHKVMGHGIQRLYPDGTPPEAPGHATWAAGALAGSIARLDNWEVSPHNILPEFGPTGGQADQGFTRCEPYYYPSALLAAYLEGCRWGAKCSFFAELNGDVLDLAARPNFRAFDGRPHPPTTQNEPGQPGSGMLGKPGEINPAVHSEDWGGFGMQHWWLNGLVAAARYTGRRGPQKLLEFNSNLYLASRFPAGFGSNTAIFSTRDLMLEGCNTVHFWVNLRNRTMATALRDRARARANGVWVNWINPTHGFPPAYWQVYPGPGTTASTPNVPAYIPWQQGPGAYWLDLCRRVLGGMESLVGGIVAGAYRVLDDVWTFEFSPTFGVNRWVEYEQIQLPPPYGAGIRGRDGNWTVDWFPPLIALIRRLEPTNSKANAIWAQMLAQLGGGGQWIPPESLATPAEGRTADGLGYLSILGDASASTVPTRQAEGVGWLSLWFDADAVSGTPPSGPPALRGGPLALRRLGGEIKSWPRWKWGR